MTSPQFVAFVERKLRENKIAKILPDPDLLVKVYTSMERGRRLEGAAESLLEKRELQAPEEVGTARQRDAATPSSASPKTWAKLEVAFWDYLGDRFAVPGTQAIPPLSKVIIAGARAPQPPRLLSILQISLPTR